VRELEQCVRSFLVRQSYTPPRSPASMTPLDALRSRLETCSLSADELTDFYCAFAYQKTQSYQETARRLGLDRRTVKARIARQTMRG
jgi:ActR/RegA family two-component response regulator